MFLWSCSSTEWDLGILGFGLCPEAGEGVREPKGPSLIHDEGKPKEFQPGEGRVVGDLTAASGSEGISKEAKGDC